MALPDGTRVGPYEIAGLLGRGGMGEVYRARDSRLRRDVALKILPGVFAADPDRLARFEREARATAALSHPNILAIHDVGADGAIHFAACELLEGRTLRDTLDARRLTAREAVDYTTQIARGLAAAHGKGIVHRDLKPENIFLTGDGHVKILDFGLAKLLAPSLPGDEPTIAGATATGAVLGTAGYMSPEQVRGQDTDARSDIFSTGAVIYEMLAGRRAFAGDSAVESMHRVLDTDVPPLARADLPPGLEPIVRRCLEKDPARRFGSASDLVFALQQLSGAPAAAAGAGQAPAPWRYAAIAAIVALAAIAAGWFALGKPRGGGPSPGGVRAPVRSIAVLPLANNSRDAGQEYFADGMTEALISDLARLGGLRVISRTSVMQYRNTTKSMPQIARDLNVDAVVEGSVARVGSRVRIDAKLVDAVREEPIWAQSYERDEQDVLSLERDVARSIADAIHSALTPADEARLPQVRQVSPAAHENYLKGRYALNKFTEEDLHAAIEFFKASLQADPNYAPAYAGMADAYTALRSIWVDPNFVMPPAKAAAIRAIELDPALAEAHVSLGSIKMFYDFDWAGAETELTHALALNPNLAEGHHQNALRLSALGRHQEAIKEIRLAEALDPLSSLIVADVSWVYYCARDYPQALEAGKRAEALDPRFWFGAAMLGLAYEKAGKLDLAIATLERARTLEQSPMVLEMLGGTYAASGQPDKARKVLADLARLEQERYVCPYEVATVYAGLGDKRHALEWLKKAHAARADCTPWMNVDAKFDSLRNDPEFKELSRQMQFKQ